MMDRLTNMSVLLAVVDKGSFSAAARHLRMPLATVSRKIAELEQYLKIRLLNRSTRRLELTENGRTYVASCRRILSEIEDIERNAIGEYTAPKGRLIITAPVSFGRLHLLPIVNEFLKAYPEIDIQLLLTDRVIDLIDEHIDVSLRIGKLHDSGLIAVRVSDVRHVLCASPDYLKQHGMPTVLNDLATQDCVTLQSLASSSTWSFGNGKRSQIVTVHSRLTVPIAEAAVDAAIAGIGVAYLLSYQIAEALKSGVLVPIMPKYESAPIPVHLVYLGYRTMPLKLRAFLDFAIPRLKEV